VRGIPPLDIRSIANWEVTDSEGVDRVQMTKSIDGLRSSGLWTRFPIERNQVRSKASGLLVLS